MKHPTVGLCFALAAVSAVAACSGDRETSDETQGAARGSVSEDGGAENGGYYGVPGVEPPPLLVPLPEGCQHPGFPGGDQHIDFPALFAKLVAAKPAAAQAHAELLAERYDFSDRPSSTVRMSRGKPVQTGVRVKLPPGLTWDDLDRMTPQEIRERDLFPRGFFALPHPNHPAGGQVFTPFVIDELRRQTQGFRDLQRFDVDFDLPDAFLPEFPPAIFLTNHPEMGDVSRGQVVTIRNFYELFKALLNPKQLEGLRLLLSPFPQQEFNLTDDRRVELPSLGVACFDCHINGHTTGSIENLPDQRPQPLRRRGDTVSLRGVANQQIFGSKRALQTVEDFSEFEQRTAYFDGDITQSRKKGEQMLDRAVQVVAMAEVQRLLDFPPAPKLRRDGRLDPSKATAEELRGERLFHGKGQCASCHPPPSYLDNQLHDLRLERFYAPRVLGCRAVTAEGPIKAFTLRGIKESPPYLHDGRLLTLEDTVEFFNIVLQTHLTEDEKRDLVAFLYLL